MLFWIYNVLLILALPFLSVQLTLRALFSKKRSFISYLFPKLPEYDFQKKTIWIHAVSLGEVNTASHFIGLLAKEAKGCQIYLSTVTETGFLAALKLKHVKVFYLPLDITFLQKRIIKALKPSCFIAVEGDVWPTLGKLLKKQGVTQVIASAKISERTCQRLQKFKSISLFLYDHFDFIYAQDKVMQERFISIGVEADKIKIAGNLKFGKPAFIPVCSSLEKRLEAYLKGEANKKTLVISCTHENEEELILDRLKPLLNAFNVILIPRHPQRFRSVYTSLKNHGYELSLLSEESDANPSIKLIDALGVVSYVYEKADLVILGGSFIEGIGGHNLLEPVYCSCPVIVGPFMEAQLGLVKLLKDEKLGIQTSIDQLLYSIQLILQDKQYHKNVSLFLTKNYNPALSLLEFLKKDVLKRVL